MKFVSIKIFCLATLCVLLQSIGLNAVNWGKIISTASAIVSIKSELGQQCSTPEDCSPEDGLWNIYQPEPVSFLEGILQKTPPLPKTTQFGYGFFISSDGYILTSYLSIKDAQKITVTISEQLQTESVTLVGYDAKSNLALLKIDGENYTYLALDTCAGKAGDWALGVGKTETGKAVPRFGVISYYPRSNAQVISFETLIQSDLPQCEMTGDPLLNMEGVVLGVNVFSDTSPTLTIPTYIAKEFVNRLLGPTL
ncbi:MAG: S1C family serine protease [Chlamydiales bacterium]